VIFVHLVLNVPPICALMKYANNALKTIIVQLIIVIRESVHHVMKAQYAPQAFVVMVYVHLVLRTHNVYIICAIMANVVNAMTKIFVILDLNVL
jgi:hypothetical protein